MESRVRRKEKKELHTHILRESLGGTLFAICRLSLSLYFFLICVCLSLCVLLYHSLTTTTTALPDSLIRLMLRSVSGVTLVQPIPVLGSPFLSHFLPRFSLANMLWRVWVRMREKHTLLCSCWFLGSLSLSFLSFPDWVTQSQSGTVMKSLSLYFRVNCVAVSSPTSSFLDSFFFSSIS